MAGNSRRDFGGTMSTDQTPQFIDRAIADLCGLASRDRQAVRVLDFGCGAGGLVGALLDRGYDAHGCDIQGEWTRKPVVSVDRIRFITREPYTLPFADDEFDVVLSTSVLEHAQNTEECLREIARVLKPGGVSMHLVPNKWYFPKEPHIYVPLANYFWPKVPKWWLQFWAWAGVRNEYQQGKSWREVSDLNAEYCRRGLIYLTKRQFKDVSLRVFGNFSIAERFFVDHSHGRASAMARSFPVRALSDWLVSTFRMMVIVSRKPA